MKINEVLSQHEDGNMKIKLVYRDIDLGVAWEQYFSPGPAVEIIQGDICQIPCDALVSPANSFGFMDGGLDHALSDRFGWDLQKRLQAEIARLPVGELLVGQALVVETGDPAIPWLISAPTMRVPMRLRHSVNAYLAMKAILAAVESHKQRPAIGTIAIPGLGTGVGGLSAEIAALQMWTAYRERVLGEIGWPVDFSEAQKRHYRLNPDEINLWDP